MLMEENKMTADTINRPKINYETGKDGRLDRKQYGIALDYIRRLQTQIYEEDDSELVDKIGKEFFTFVKTLPDADKEEAIETIRRENSES